MKNLIKISKREKEVLLTKGCVFHKDIHKTYTRYPHYYLTESARNLKLIYQIRNGE